MFDLLHSLKQARAELFSRAELLYPRFGEERFCKMLDPDGAMEIPQLRKPTEGHLALVERDYRSYHIRFHFRV